MPRFGEKNPGGFDKDIRLILVNAIYFLVSLHEAFEEDETRKAQFPPRPDGSTIDVDMMHRAGRSVLLKADGTKGVGVLIGRHAGSGRWPRCMNGSSAKSCSVPSPVFRKRTCSAVSWHSQASCRVGVFRVNGRGW